MINDDGSIDLGLDEWISITFSGPVINFETLNFQNDFNIQNYYVTAGSLAIALGFCFKYFVKKCSNRPNQPRNLDVSV